jgi:hypothetical protein
LHRWLKWVAGRTEIDGLRLLSFSGKLLFQLISGIVEKDYFAVAGIL